MTKEYAHLRIENMPLHTQLKIRAAKEGKTMITITEQALKEYLRKPLDK